MLRDKFLAKSENEDFHSFDYSEVYADGGQWNADAATAGTSNPSQPFIVTLTNGTGSAISNVAFLDAINSIGAANDGVTTGVTATYDIPGKTYEQFLRYLQSAPSLIGQVTTASDTASNLRKAFKITTYNMQGDDFSKTIFPIYNTMQNVLTQVDTNVEFYLNASTQVILTQLAAGSSISFYFYPRAVASTVAAISSGRTFVNPQTSGTRIIGAAPTQKIS